MVPTEQVVPEEKIFNKFLIGSNFELSLAVAAILVGKRVIGYNSERGPPKDHFSKVWFQLSKYLQTRRFFNEFPIGFNVKLSSAVAAIFVGRRGHRIQF